MAYMLNDDGVIIMNRGDNADLHISLVLVDIQGNETGPEYTMQPGDTLTLTVRKRPDKDYPVEMSVTSTNNIISILPEHTKKLAVGKYSADIQLNYDGGKVMTVFPNLEDLDDSQLSKTRSWNNFIIVGEVTIDD